MHATNLSRRSIGRLSLETAALKTVCACQYYDLQNSLETVSSRELINIINHKSDCARCSRRGVIL
jgi:hypothetical protein